MSMELNPVAAFHYQGETLTDLGLNGINGNEASSTISLGRASLTLGVNVCSFIALDLKCKTFLLLCQILGMTEITRQPYKHWTDISNHS